MVPCNPDSVLVYAPEGILDTITTAYTQNITLENISDTTRRRVPLTSERGVKFVPASVEMTFPVDIYTEKTVEVPLHGVNFPADKVLRTFPSKVQITFQVGLKRFRSIKASDFIINISYEELLKGVSNLLSPNGTFTVDRMTGYISPKATCLTLTPYYNDFPLSSSVNSTEETAESTEKTVAESTEIEVSTTNTDDAQEISISNYKSLGKAFTITIH